MAEKKKEFKVMYVTGVAIGVGIQKIMNGGIYSENICSTLYDTGNDEKDAKDSEKWAKMIVAALNKKS